MDLNGIITEVEQQAGRNFSSLDTTQLNWKPSPEKWSIGQCLEHLVISNRNYFPFFDKILAGTYKLGFFQRLNPFKKLTGSYMVRSLGPELKKKFKSPRIFRPSLSEVNPAIVEEFLDQQSIIRNYFDRLKSMPTGKFYMASPVTPMIVYSVQAAMEIIAVHEQRHLNQAITVMNHPNFPK